MFYDLEETGQKLDSLKEVVIIPEISMLIQGQFPNGTTEARCMDLGTGDASTFLALLGNLEQADIRPNALAMVDCSTNVFPRIIQNTTEAANVDKSLFVCQPDRSYDFGPNLNFYRNSVDFITAQMLFHQILNDAELSLLLCRAFLAMKDDGCVYVTDFNPDYIDFLAKNDPQKLKVTRSRNIGGLEGVYTLGQGSSYIPIISRDERSFRSMLSLNGFHVTNLIQPSLERVRDVKQRYNTLFESGISMFNIYKVEKRKSSFISFETGIVRQIKIEKSEQMRIIFNSNDSVAISKISNYEAIRKGDEVILFEVRLPNGMHVTQVWVIPKDEKSKIWSTILLADLKSGQK